MIVKVKELFDGSILWYEDVIVGVKGMTLPKMFYECECYKVGNNSVDFETCSKLNEEQKSYIEKKKEEQDYE